MAVATKIQMLDGDDGIFRFLGVIDLKVHSSGLAWHLVDIESPGVEAACMYGYIDPLEGEVAYVLVGDVSGDPSEPVIYPMSDDEVSNLNIDLERGTREFCRDQGFEFVRWMDCNFNQFRGIDILVSAYIVEMPNIGEQQRITARFHRDGRKWLIETAFSVALADKLAKPMFLTLHPINIADG